MCYGSQAAAIFKIGSGKELPAIPDHLSEDGKDFIRQCLQRNPLHHPMASQLLEHPFVKLAAPLERVEKPVLGPEPSDPSPGVSVTARTLVLSHNAIYLKNECCRHCCIFF